ncbi:DNA-binding transcriptional regulator, MerR family [Microlunatus soli]|uniref:DNA-binding transcriptional regulator, MerR family n=1 Tax=Microlunatus soli TaxID=630515 RepID=A0A1H1UH74_9ACTN|nr:DNA-binding transcriptional regulator, MerR family [Microlunatus soli]
MGSRSSLTIRQMADRSGFSEHTLRYYEEIGLIGPVDRDPSSGHRRYSPALAERVEALGCLRATGMSIEQLRSYLTGLAAGRKAAPAMTAPFAGHAEHLESEIAALTLRLDYARAKADLWRSRMDDDAVGEQEAVRVAEELAHRLKGSVTP